MPELTPKDVADVAAAYDAIAPLLLVDLFAGMAAAGLMADKTVRLENPEIFPAIAQISYKLARALVAERLVSRG